MIKTFERSDIALYILFASGTVVYYLLPFWAGAFIDDYQFTEKQTGFLLSADMAANTLAAFLSQYWIQKLPWRPVLLAAIAAITGGNLLCLFGDTFLTILSARLVCGFAAGSMVAISYGALSSHHNPVRQFSLAMGLQIIFGMTCISVFPYIPVDTNPGNIFLVIILLNLLPLGFITWLPKRDQHRAKLEEASFDVAKKEQKNLFFLFAILLFFAAMTIIWVYMERLGINLNFSEHQIANILTISLLFSLAGSLSPILSAKCTSKQASLYAALAGLFIVVVWIPEIETLWAYASFIMIYNFLYSYAIPFQADLLSEADTTGRSIVLLPAAQGIGVATGPVLSGFVVAQYSYTEAVYCSAALIILVLIFSRLFLSKGRNRII